MSEIGRTRRRCAGTSEGVTIPLLLLVLLQRQVGAQRGGSDSNPASHGHGHDQGCCVLQTVNESVYTTTHSCAQMHRHTTRGRSASHWCVARTTIQRRRRRSFCTLHTHSKLGRAWVPVRSPAQPLERWYLLVRRPLG